MAWVLPVSFAIFLAIKYTVGLRVSVEEELQGLDLSEHGILAYHVEWADFAPMKSLSTGNSVAKVLEAQRS